MSTNGGGSANLTIEAKHLAKGFDRALVRLLQLSPFALLLLLLSDAARSYSGMIIAVCVGLAILFAFTDISN